MRMLVADKLAEEGLEFLKQQEVELRRQDRAEGGRAGRGIVGEYDALIVRSGAKVTAKVLENPGKLKAIARAGVGVDNIDLDAATAKGILVLNTAEASTLSTAEHALALMMTPGAQDPRRPRAPASPARSSGRSAASTRARSSPARRSASSGWAASGGPSPPARSRWR